jgi:hypothetical protein
MQGLVQTIDGLSIQIWTLWATAIVLSWRGTSGPANTTTDRATPAQRARNSRSKFLCSTRTPYSARSTSSWLARICSLPSAMVFSRSA